MQLAFVLYKYFPFGGLQRDFLRIALECQKRGHQIRVYTMSWQGEIPEGFDVNILPAKGWSNHRRHQNFFILLQQALKQHAADLLVGFNKMPGLDVYYAADTCYEAKAQQQRSKLYRLLPRYKHYQAYEQAVFAAGGKTQILMISEQEQTVFQGIYQTEPQRFHQLPPGINKDRKAPSNAAEIRQQFRCEFGFGDDDLLVLQVGSGFKTKGLDRSIRALAALENKLKKRTRLFVVGQDNAKPFIRLAKDLAIADQLVFLQGRDDIPRFLLGADVLIHPAYNENTGTVLLEALVAGLPVLVSDVCGYAHYINDADCGVVVKSPFEQSQLNQALSMMLTNLEARNQWQKNALQFAETADLYSMPERAADIILSEKA